MSTFQSSATQSSGRKRTRWSVPFRLAVIGPTFAMILVSSAAFVALAVLSHQAQQSTLQEWRLSNDETLQKWRNAVVAAQNFAVKEQAILVERSILVDFVEPPGNAVDTLLGAVRTRHQKDGWDFKGNGLGVQNEEVQLRDLEARAWETLGNQWKCKFANSEICSGRANSLYTSMQNGGVGGAAYGEFNGKVESRLLSKVSGGDLKIWHANNLTGQREGKAMPRDGGDPRLAPSFTVQANCISPWCTRRKAWTELYLLSPWLAGPAKVTQENPNYHRKENGVGNWGGECACPNGEIYQVGDNSDKCQTLACEGGISRSCSATGISSQNAGRKVTCNAFNTTFAPIPVLALSRTAPISLNNGFVGVVGADVSTDPVSEILHEQWKELRRNLLNVWGFSIGSETSSIFVINQVSERFPQQAGTLIGTSEEGWFGKFGGALTQANKSSLPIVANVSRAILAKYNDNWGADELLNSGDEVFYFSLDALSAGKYESCHPLENRPGHNDCLEDCVQVATHSMSLDDSVRWLIVVALPAAAYFTTYTEKVLETTESINDAQVRANETMNFTNTVCIAIIACATLIAFLVASVTNCLVLRPLSRLGVMMERLSHLDFAHDTTSEYIMLQQGVRGRVREVNVLREGFCRLSQSIQTFAKFVPETVVRELVCDDEQKRRRAAHLHVTKRNVTIMFSDVKDFTTISEALPQKQLLFVLTLYLTVMTRIIESFEGVVGEVLGDGLLCFWNTPDLVGDHAAKACKAALAQQQALGPLNAELANRGLPELQIRIGLHTGEVYTGNIGSEQKMKFGCMGDPVNLASRLEGLCKVYGVGIMFSGATHKAIPDDFGLVTRRLDLVQVKGKHEPTEIFELVGCHHSEPTWGIEAVKADQIQQALMYEEALMAYQKANFLEAVRLTECLQIQLPEDVAVGRLLERAKHYAGQGVDIELASPGSAEQWTGVEKMLDK